MSQLYDKLDSLIISAVSRGNKNPMYNPDVFAEAGRIGEETRRNRAHVVSGRLTALRKSGAIRYLQKENAPEGKFGWHLVPTKR